MAEIAGGGGGGRTSFEGLTHEQMLAWLDQADKDSVKAAADRLSEAAFDIREIAQQLKFRPERVEWKGEGFQAFVDWGASLSSATFRLADYSDEASKAMADAAVVIAEVQSAVPRDIAGSKANLEAALDHPNEPDSDDVASKARADLDKKRHEAIAQMNKLAQAYDQSKTRMAAQELPTFQPPPDRFVPEAHDVASSENFYRSGSADSSSTSVAYATPASREESGTRGTPTQHVERPVAPESRTSSERPVAMEIDSVETLKPTPTTPTPVGPTMPRQETGGLPPLGPVAPVPSTRTPVSPVTQGGTPRGPAGGRPPFAPGQLGPTGQSGPVSRLPRDNAITGGRPVPPSGGKPSGGIPRGTVIGHENVHGRSPLAHGGGGMGGPGTQNGSPAGRRLAGEAGGVVGGRPQQSGAVTGRPFTPGGSGLVRNPNAGAAGSAVMRGAPSQQNSGERRDESQAERPDYLVEDEETWQQSRRVAPPVID